MNKITPAYFKQTVESFGYPCLSQPLIKGVFCTAKDNQTYVELFNKIGDPIHSVPHIPTRLNANGLWEHELVGMLWHPNYSDKELNNIIIRSSSIPLHTLSETITFYIYDIKSLKSKATKRSAVLTMLSVKGPNLKVVPTAIINCWEELVLLNGAYIHYNYDGSLIRKADGLYDELENTIKLEGYVE